MSFRLSTSLANILNQLGFHKVSWETCMDPVLFALAFHCLNEIDSSSRGLDDFSLYDFATASLQCCLAERTVYSKRQKADDGPVVPDLTTAVYVELLLGVERETISDVAVFTGGTVMLLMMMKSYEMTSRPMLLTTLMVYLCTMRIGRLLVAPHLWPVIVRLFPQLEHGF